jgi:uncharacterized repeat protein (TIGR01451 family)
MNKALAMMVLVILCSSLFSILPPKAMGWAGIPVSANHHGEMARDTLLGLVDKGLLTYEDIGDIPEYANNVDRDLPHPGASCHRVRKYQDIFESYGGEPCTHSGAEWHAAEHIHMAYEYYSVGNVAEAQRHLGYAIHYIQDAACPPHVFPFREAWYRTNPYRPDIPAHAEFESYANDAYGLRNWPQLVRNAPIWYISGPDDLRKKVIWLADMVAGLDCSYVRQDETIVGTLPSGMDWYISDENIGFCMAMAASLVKGAILYATQGPYNGRSGGPDSFGYKFIDSYAPVGPTYEWIEISGTGTEILPDSDDQWVTNVNIGFFFNFYGTDYSQVAIGNNGLLFSGEGTWQYINDPITQSPRIHGFIAPYWDDIVTWGSAGAIYYRTIGDAPNRKFVVEWYNNQHYHHSDRGITFEVMLFEGTNNILFQYKDVTFGTVYGAVSGDNPPYDFGGSATVGIEDPTGTIGLQYSFNEQVITPGLAILFKFPAFAGTNMYISMNAPASMDRGNTMTYAIYYNNFGNQEASNVILRATLSPNVNFISASDGGEYNPDTRTVTWNIGAVSAFPSGRGSRTITVTIPSDVPIGTVIQTTASVSTSTLETRYDDNTASAQTTVTGTNLPPNVSVGPTVGTVGGVPSVYWRTPITFTYYNPTAISVNIRIHLDDGGPDITGSMVGGPPTWTYTVTFYPRTGRATVTYTVNDPTPYSAEFDLRNIRGFEETITAAEIENYIRSVAPNSPMLTEAGIGQRFIDAGRSNNVNPAFLVATAQHEGVFGTQGWAASHPEAHNTMGWAIPYPDTPVVWEAGYYWVPSQGTEVYLYRNAFSSWGNCIEFVAQRIAAPAPGLYYGAGHYTVNEVRTVYAREPAVETIVNYMNALARSSGQAGVFDENFNIYVDPAGYVYDVTTGERIAGAIVRLQRPDGQGGWENVPTGQTPPIMQPDLNPQTTGPDGQYQWDVLEGTYRVHVEAPGYYPADSIVVTIPPPVTDLHVGLTPLPSPPDPEPPITTLIISDPKYIDPTGDVYVTLDTSFMLSAEDNVGGSGVATTGYRIRNTTYDSGWITSTPPIEFYLTTLADGAYLIDYNSTDNVGNVEATHTVSLNLDNSGPSITIENPPPGWALQDGVTFIALSTDPSGTYSLNFSMREANGDQGIPVGFEDMPATYNTATGKWELFFNTLQLPDGYYTVLVSAEDNLGHTAAITVPYSIRNWAVLELLPATPNNKAGRTMPIKFALRVAASVDPNQPFVYNEELTIKIYATDNPSNILQTSTFGDTARDYRINTISEHYITNFQTLKTPKTYTVEIWRKNMLIGSFNFQTVK